MIRSTQNEVNLILLLEEHGLIKQPTFSIVNTCDLEGHLYKKNKPQITQAADYPSRGSQRRELNHS